MGLSSSKHKKPKGPAITDVDKAILSLKAQRKKLVDQQKLLELRIDRHTELARELVKEKQSSKALLVLKKKKLVENQLEKLTTLLFSTESMISDVEMGKQQNQVFNVLKAGNDTMKQLQKEVTVDDVRKLMEDTADAKAYQDEISAMLSENLTHEDADAVETEFEALEAEVLSQEVAKLPAAPAVPEGFKAPTAAELVAQKEAAQVAQQAQQEEEAQEELPPRQALLAS